MGVPTSIGGILYIKKVGWEYLLVVVEFYIYIEGRVGVPTSICGILYIYIEGRVGVLTSIGCILYIKKVGWEYLLVLVENNTDRR